MSGISLLVDRRRFASSACGSMIAIEAGKLVLRELLRPRASPTDTAVYVARDIGVSRTCAADSARSEKCQDPT